MKNSEKAELRRDVKELAQKGYSQKDAIKILKEYGYTDSTARMYWKCFGTKQKEKAERTHVTKHVIPPKSKDSGILPNLI